METRVTKWGDGLAVRIPQSIAIRIGLRPDCPVELSTRGTQLLISVVKQPRAQLAELLDGVTPENRHGEVDTGSAAGREIW